MAVFSMYIWRDSLPYNNQNATGIYWRLDEQTLKMRKYLQNGGEWYNIGLLCVTISAIRYAFQIQVWYEKLHINYPCADKHIENERLISIP